MKVSLEGTTTEFEELAELITYGNVYKAQRTAEDRAKLQAAYENSRAGRRSMAADIPDRDREEGVQ